MIAWFTSLNGVVTLSVVALLTLVGRTFLDARYVLTEDYPDAGKGMVGLSILGFLALVGGWIWALLATAGGSQAAMIVLMVLNVLTGLGAGAASLLAFHPVMPSAKPMGEIALWSNLIVGVIASISVGLRLWGAGG